MPPKPGPPTVYGTIGTHSRARCVPIQADPEDARALAGFAWWFSRGEPITQGPDGKVRLGAYILGLMPYEQLYYLNGDPLDCRRANLSRKHPAKPVPLFRRSREELFQMAVECE